MLLPPGLAAPRLNQDQPYAKQMPPLWYRGTVETGTQSVPKEESGGGVNMGAQRAFSFLFV